jgi:hypothetical protein
VKDGADRCGVRIADNKHSRSMGMQTMAAKSASVTPTKKAVTLLTEKCF